MISSGTRPSLVSSSWSRPAWWASARRATHSAAVANAVRCPAWQARTPSPTARWVLPVPGRAEEHDVLAGGDEVQGPEVGQSLALERALVLDVEVLEGLAGREAGGADAALTAVGFAGGDLALQAGGEELLVGPALGPGPFGEALDRGRERGCLECPGQIGQLGGEVAPLVAGWSPSRRLLDRLVGRVVETEERGRSRTGRAAATSLDGRRAAFSVGLAQPGRGVGMLVAGDGLVPRPAAGVGGDPVPVEGDQTCSRSAVTVDAAPDRAGVHRVVVAIEADVVIPR